MPATVKTLDKGKGIASEPPKRLEGTRVLHVMVIDTSKWIFQAGELSSLERWKKFKRVRKQLVRRKPRMRTKL